MKKLSRNRLFLSSVALLFVVVLLCATLGCCGKFPITKSVYKFNREVSEDKYITSFVFWGLVILPVYKFAMIGDAIVCNPIEFWTEKEIIAEP